jgi:hypothetical protein
LVSVVMRHVRDQSLVAALIGDVEVGGDEAAADERPSSDFENGAIRARPLVDMRLSLAHQRHAAGNLLLGVARPVFAAQGVEPEQPFQAGQALREQMLGIVEKHPLLLVAKHHLQVGIEQRNAPGEILDDRFEHAYCLAQRPDMAADLADGGGKCLQVTPWNGIVRIPCQVVLHRPDFAGDCPGSTEPAQALLAILRI